MKKRRKIEVEVKVEEKKEEIAQQHVILYIYKPRLSRGASSLLRSLLPQSICVPTAALFLLNYR